MPRFETMSRRVVLRGTVELVSGLHIGSGRSAAVNESDNPVVKDFFGRPYIPGSSLKGAIRAVAESLLRGIGSTTAWACDPLEAPCPRPPDDFEPGLKDRRRERERHWSRIVASWDLERQLEGSCTACRLFGSRLFASKLTVPDLAVEGRWNPRHLQYREAGAIDRESETAADAHRLEFEVVPPGTAFRMELAVDNPAEVPADEIGLLLAAIDALDQGWQTLGGKRAFGLGRVAVRLNDARTVTADQLLAGHIAAPVGGEELAKLLAGHRARLTQSLGEGTHVSNPA